MSDILPILGSNAPASSDAFETPKYYGPLVEWDGHAKITGPCGDTMEYWLVVRDGCVEEIGFTTTGCGSSQVAGGMAAELAQGRPVADVLNQCPTDVLKAVGGLPPEHEHCAVLAMTTLKAAIRDSDSGGPTRRLL